MTRLRRVDIERHRTNDTAVLGGASAVQRVILFPSDLIADGVHVAAQ